MIPKAFYVVGGKAIDKVSGLNAFDKALLNGKIGNYNLVYVSSILPKGIHQLTFAEKQDFGSIVHCVLARMDGVEGETVSAGLTWGFDKERKGIVAEAHGYMKNKQFKELLRWKLGRMAEIRRMKLTETYEKIETLSVPMDHYGATVVALCYII